MTHWKIKDLKGVGDVELELDDKKEKTMSELTLNFEDNLAKDLQAFVSQQSVKQLTMPLLKDFVNNRQARYQQDTDNSSKPKDKHSEFLQLLEATKGTWQNGDGLEYQLAIRSEWDHRP